MDLSGRYFIDNIDLWIRYSTFVSKGSSELLKYPPKKESITHDWADSHGIDIDTSRIFLDQRQPAISFTIIATDEPDFWKKHDDFIALLIQPGLRRLQFASHGLISYFVVYKECNSYEDVTKLLGITATRKIAMRFNVVFIEPEPDHAYQHTFLADDTGRFIIT